MSTKSRKPRLLVADESISIQRLVNLALADQNWEVIIATDGQDASAKVKSLKPDVILADAKLRQVDGLSLCELVRRDKNLYKTRFILMSGALEKPSAKRIETAQVDHILKKPFDANALLKALDEIDKEESTVVQMQPIKSEALDQRLEAIAAEVDRENHQATPQPLPPATSQASLESVGREEIIKWIQAHLPEIAERLIKEEIQKQIR